MFVQFDDMTDEPVCVGLTGSGRVRIAYSDETTIRSAAEIREALQ